jgi:two-component system, cell cycle response regulator
MKVLVADDDAITRRTLCALLYHLGHETVEAHDGNMAWDIIHQPDAPSLILLDWMMPGPDGIEICRRLRSERKRPYQHVLMISGRGSMDDLLEGIGAGADEYVSKPFDLREVRVRVRAAERMLAAQDELRAQAITDELTGLMNRRGILERLQHELALVARDGRDLSVMMIDIDHFKVVNDTHGHAVGDEVLQDVAQRMRRQLRVYDDIGRVGGEEFAVLLPECAAAAAAAVAERMRSTVASDLVKTAAGAVPVTVSIGVTSVDTLREYEPANVLAQADRALYAAKSGGRNRVATEVAATKDGRGLQ